MKAGDRIAWVGGAYHGEFGTVIEMLVGGYIEAVFDRWPDERLLVARSEIRPA